MNGNEREVDVDDMVTGQIVAKLPDGLKKWQALDIADGAADLAKDEIALLVSFADEFLDGVGDMGNHLDGGAEIVAAPFLGENLLINATGRDVVVPAGRPAR